MDYTIENWLKARKVADEAVAFIDTALDEASYLRAENFDLRPATAADIVEGAIIWYPRWEEDEDDDVRSWRRVEEVYYPSDQWKAYCADCGCRYGLDGAFVEVETV